MYESPIEIKVLDDFEMTMEKNVVKVVQHYGIAVDRDELIRALRYDRGQYERGYKDGAANVPRWIPYAERVPEEGQMCLVCHKGQIAIDKYIGHGNPYNWHWYLQDYDAWMPLPDPWKGENNE